MSNSTSTKAGERTQHSAGWFYALPEDVVAGLMIPSGKKLLISDKGEFGYPVYSSGGYCVQIVEPNSPRATECDNCGAVVATDDITWHENLQHHYCRRCELEWQTEVSIGNSNL